MSTLGPTAADLHELLDAQLKALEANSAASRPAAPACRPASTASRPAAPAPRADLWSSPDLPFPGLAARPSEPPEPEPDADAHLPSEAAEDLPADADAHLPVEVADLDLVLSSSRRFAWARLPLRRGAGPARLAGLARVRPSKRVLLVAAAAVVLVGALAAAAVVLSGHAASGTPAAAGARHPISGGSGASSGRAGSSSSGTGSLQPKTSSVQPKTSSVQPKTSPTQPKSSLPKSAIITPATSVPATSVPATPTPTVPASTPGGSGTASSGPDLTAAEAKLVLAGLWPKRVAAVSGRDASALGAVDSGAALQGDTAAITAGTAPADVDLSEAQVFLVATQAYPLSFAAEMSGTGASGPVEELATFSQPSASAPWMVTLVVDVPTSGSTSSSSPGGTATPVGVGALDALAASWQQWAQSGTPPSGGAVPFDAAGGYTQVGERAAGQVAMSTMSGLHEQVTFQADTSSVVQMPEPIGALCGAVDETAVFTGAKGGPVTQPASQATWGTSVAPGQYESVTEQSVYQVCLVGTTAAVVVGGGTGGVYSTTASPAA